VPRRFQPSMRRGHGHRDRAPSGPGHPRLAEVTRPGRSGADVPLAIGNVGGTLAEQSKCGAELLDAFPCFVNRFVGALPIDQVVDGRPEFPVTSRSSPFGMDSSLRNRSDIWHAPFQTS
jgi:hypothetical protein